MPTVNTDDGYELYYEEAGNGQAIVFVHEYAGDYRSWEPQMRHFARRFRCITYSARGFPPSAVPENPADYSQARACDDILAILDGLEIDQAHIVGLSMGGFAALHFGLTHPARALSLVVAGCGYGAEKDQRAQFVQEANATADLIESGGMEAFAKTYSLGPTRVQFQNADPRGWQEFESMLAEHSAIGSANTMRGVQSSRPSIFDLEAGLRSLHIPTLIVTGDEDEPCLLPGIFMKRSIPTAALVVLPNAGHTINIEAPQAFNTAVEEFLLTVLAGRWPTRDARSMGGSILGVKP
ncbi:MAG: alpha/beta hydrolase [Gammaproteobacteria bacterium]|nr:alpha/beta hydrolase [Gammaproteobacteria bacterium]